MKPVKRILYQFASTLKIIIIISLLTCIPCSAIDTDSSSFMNLESSINELTQVVEKVSGSIVMIVVYDITGEEVGSGSGFFIDREGRILTNAILMKDAYSAEVFSKSNHYSNVAILNRDESLDFALIQVKAINEKPVEFDVSYQIKEGDRVLVIGKARDLNKTFSEGLITSVYKDGEKLEAVKAQPSESILSFQAAANGPLLNLSGTVTGMTTSIFPDNLYFRDSGTPFDKSLKAISIKSLKPFLARPHKVESLHDPKSKVWFRWLIRWINTKAITGFIVLYEIGFQKIMLFILATTVLISLIQWFYNKLKKTI